MLLIVKLNAPVRWPSLAEGGSVAQVLGEDAADRLLAAAPGVTVRDDPGEGRYPMPIEAAGRDDVFVGRIRRDPGNERALDLWVVSDNLRKGAATNAVQLAELLIERDLLG